MSNGNPRDHRSRLRTAPHHSLLTVCRRSAPATRGGHRRRDARGPTVRGSHSRVKSLVRIAEPLRPHVVEVRPIPMAGESDPAARLSRTDRCAVRLEGMVREPAEHQLRWSVAVVLATVDPRSRLKPRGCLFRDLDQLVVLDQIPAAGRRKSEIQILALVLLADPSHGPLVAP